eukprot:scaffold39894_cov61-Phaeocystis_antarctica.AAC.8
MGDVQHPLDLSLYLVPGLGLGWGQAWTVWCVSRSRCVMSSGPACSGCNRARHSVEAGSLRLDLWILRAGTWVTLGSERLSRAPRSA